MKTNWQTKELGEVCNVIAGQSPEGKYYNKINDGLPFYQGKKKFTNKFIDNPDTWTTKTTKESLKGDILMSVRAPVGPINFATQKICIGRGLAAIRVSEKIDVNFLFYFLKNFENKIVGNNGAVFNSINKKQIENFQIPLPPLSEQHRIVKTLDQLFTKIETAKKNAEKNLQNSKELFESYLQNVFVSGSSSAKATTDKWEGKNLGEVCNIVGGGTPSKAGSNFNKFYNGNILWATVRDMKNNVIIKTEHKITKDAVRQSSTNIIPKNNIIIASRVGLGKVCFLENDTAINQDLRGVIPVSIDNLSVNYLFWWFKSVAKFIIKNGRGATVHGVTLPFIKGLKIPVPPLAIQKQIVKKLNTLSTATKKLEKNYQQKITDLDELKKSILQKAFAGEL